MALKRFVGSVAQRTTDGTTDVQCTDIGGSGTFQPKVVLFFASNRTADGGGAHALDQRGWAVQDEGGGTVQGSVAFVSVHGGTSSSTSSKITNADAIALFTDAKANAGEADVSAWNSDGFTLNWTNVDGTARIVNFLALGWDGSDDIWVEAGANAKNNTTGNQEFNETAAQPKLLLLLTAGERSTTIPSTDTVGPCTGMGWGMSSSAQAVSAWGSRDGRPTGDGVSIQITTGIARWCVGGSGVLASGNLVSLDSDGFTINWTVGTRATYFLWLAMGGADLSAAVGAFDADTDLGGQSVTGAGFQPESLVLLSRGKTSGTTATADAYQTLGVAVGDTQRAAHWTGDDNGTADAETASYLDRDKVMAFLTEDSAGGAPTLDGEADFDGFTSDGFDLDWTDAAPGAFQILYCALKGPAAVTSVFHDAWSGRLSTPLPRVAFRRQPISDPLRVSLDPEGPQLDKWYTQLSVDLRPRVTPLLPVPKMSFEVVPQEPEAAQLDKWYAPLSAPLFDAPPLDPLPRMSMERESLDAEEPRLDKWYTLLAVPLAIAPTRPMAAGQASPEPVVDTGETITVDKWFTPLGLAFPTRPSTARFLAISTGKLDVGSGLTFGLGAAWPFNEASGDALDVSGNARHLTDNNTVGADTGKVLGARSFVSGNSERFTSTDTWFDRGTAGGSFSGAIWVRVPAWVHNIGIVHKGTNHGAAANLAYILYTVNGGGANTGFEFRVSNGTAMFSLQKLSLSVDTWYHVYFEYDADADEIGLSVDNETLVTTAATGGINPSSATFEIGHSVSGYLTGLVDEGAMWDRVLTADERTTLFNLYSWGGGAVTVDQWYAPFGEPARRAPHLTALTISAGFFSEHPEATQLDKWLSSWPMPGRRSLRRSLGLSELVREAVGEITVDKWYAPTAGPTWPVGFQSTFTSGVPDTDPESPQLDKWHRPFDLPQFRQRIPALLDAVVARMAWFDLPEPPEAGEPSEFWVPGNRGVEFVLPFRGTSFSPGPRPEDWSAVKR